MTLGFCSRELSSSRNFRQDASVDNVKITLTFLPVGEGDHYLTWDLETKANVENERYH